MIILWALNLLFYSLSKLDDLGTIEQLEQGHAIEKLHVIAGLKFLRKCFHRYSVSLFLILVGSSVGWSLRSIIGSVFQILGKRLK